MDLKISCESLALPGGAGTRRRGCAILAVIAGNRYRKCLGPTPVGILGSVTYLEADLVRPMYYDLTL